MSAFTSQRLKVSCNGVEGVLQVAANYRHGANDNDGDESGDQAILDGGHAAVIS